MNVIIRLMMGVLCVAIVLVVGYAPAMIMNEIFPGQALSPYVGGMISLVAIGLLLKYFFRDNQQSSSSQVVSRDRYRGMKK